MENSIKYSQYDVAEYVAKFFKLGKIIAICSSSIWQIPNWHILKTIETSILLLQTSFSCRNIVHLRCLNFQQCSGDTINWPVVDFMD